MELTALSASASGGCSITTPANGWVKDVPAKPEELKILHKTIKKISEDIENFSSIRRRIYGVCK